MVRYIMVELFILTFVGAMFNNCVADGLNKNIVPEQEWSIKSTSLIKPKVIVGRIESWHGRVVVHVSVIDVMIPAGFPGAGATIVIAHMPFEESALVRSVDRLLAVGVAPVENFEEGYEKWRASKGAGVYTSDVTQAIDTMFKTLLHNRE